MPNYLQDAISDNHCFGCGAENHDGLQIKSHWLNDEECVCDFQPSAHHSAGPLQYLNGGIIATIIDCHCICMALSDCYRQEGREMGTGEKIWCVTADMAVRYKAPVPIDDTVRLVACITDRDGRKTKVSCRLYSGDTLCAEADVTAVRVPLEWLQ